MNKKQGFIVDLMSSIDENVINENLQKRFVFWHNRSRRPSSPSPIIPIIAIAACFAIVCTSFLLLFPKLFGTENRNIAPETCCKNIFLCMRIVVSDIFCKGAKIFFAIFYCEHILIYRTIPVSGEIKTNKRRILCTSIFCQFFQHGAILVPRKAMNTKDNIFNDSIRRSIQFARYFIRSL